MHTTPPSIVEKWCPKYVENDDITPKVPRLCLLKVEPTDSQVSSKRIVPVLSHSSTILSISGTRPRTDTSISAFGGNLPVKIVSRWLRSTDKSCKLQSHKTGVSPNWHTGARSVAQDTAGTTTASPLLICPDSNKEYNINRFAEEPELTKTAYSQPIFSAQSDSNSSVTSPFVNLGYASSQSESRSISKLDIVFLTNGIIYEIPIFSL